MRHILGALIALTVQSAAAVEPVWVDTGYVKNDGTTTVEVYFDNRRAHPFEDVPASLKDLCDAHGSRAITHITNMLQVPIPDTIAIIAREEVKGFLWRTEDIYHRADFDVEAGGCGAPVAGDAPDVTPDE